MVEPDAAHQFNENGTLLISDRLGTSGIWPTTASSHGLAASKPMMREREEH
jgi:hypothetical protein